MGGFFTAHSPTLAEAEWGSQLSRARSGAGRRFRAARCGLLDVCCLLAGADRRRGTAAPEGALYRLMTLTAPPQPLSCRDGEHFGLESVALAVLTMRGSAVHVSSVRPICRVGKRFQSPMRGRTDREVRLGRCICWGHSPTRLPGCEPGVADSRTGASPAAGMDRVADRRPVSLPRRDLIDVANLPRPGAQEVTVTSVP
jgi:hypothetical protein